MLFRLIAVFTVLSFCFVIEVSAANIIEFHQMLIVIGSIETGFILFIALPIMIAFIFLATHCHCCNREEYDEYQREVEKFEQDTFEWVRTQS